MTFPAATIHQEVLFDKAITSICSLLKHNEIAEVLHRRLYLSKERIWHWRHETLGATLGVSSLEKIMIEFACFEMCGINADLMRIKDQETFNELFTQLIARMNEVVRELSPDTPA